LSDKVFEGEIDGIKIDEMSCILDKKCRKCGRRMELNEWINASGYGIVSEGKIKMSWEHMTCPDTEDRKR